MRARPRAYSAWACERHPSVTNCTVSNAHPVQARNVQPDPRGQVGQWFWLPDPKRTDMTTRNDNNDQNKAEQKAADEAARTARTVTDEAARVGEQTARAGADIANRGTEAARNAVEAGLNTATQTFQRVTDQFTKVLGFSGPQAEELARRSSENLQAVSQASTVLARGEIGRAH